MKTVTVLLSTYNGQQFIAEQLDSLLNQMNVDIQILIRDDGSTDDTIRIIDLYMNQYKNIKLLQGNNCGCEESFHKICQYASKECTSEFYAFCDQDDVWDENKLEFAIEQLLKYPKDKPNLYFSNMRMVNSNLEYIRDYYTSKEVSNYLEKSLIQIFTFGCTCVFNREAILLYTKQQVNHAYHDNWIYVICALYGNVYYDPIPHINYRQHSSNLSGEKKTGFKLLMQRLNKLIKGSNSHVYETIASQIKTNYPDTLSHRESRRIKLLSNYRKSIKDKINLIFFNNYKTGDFVKDLCIKYRIIKNII